MSRNIGNPFLKGNMGAILGPNTVQDGVGQRGRSHLEIDPGIINAFVGIHNQT